MNRRDFIKNVTFMLLGATLHLNASTASATHKKFEHIMSNAKRQKWYLMDMGDLVARIGLEFVDTPYVSKTLDVNPHKEEIVANFSGLDCVTFFENSLCMARCIALQQYTFEQFLKMLQTTRYRNGIITDFTSRLHYTSDWIANNISKGIVEDITKQIGGQQHQFSLSYMSQHPNQYPALKHNPALLANIKNIEQKLNITPRYILPTSAIKNVISSDDVKEGNIDDGDIIAIATNDDGLDYSHIGLAFDGDLMHASSKAKKVIVGKSIYDYVASRKNSIGISVLRPIKPIV
jgi:hypothetical protein